jgi:hypothetical protein
MATSRPARTRPYASTIHRSSVAPGSSSAAIVGSATFSTVASIAMSRRLDARTARMSQRWGGDDMGDLRAIEFVYVVDASRRVSTA